MICFSFDRAASKSYTGSFIISVACPAVATCHTCSLWACDSFVFLQARRWVTSNRSALERKQMFLNWSWVKMSWRCIHTWLWLHLYWNCTELSWKGHSVYRRVISVRICFVQELACVNSEKFWDLLGLLADEHQARLHSSSCLQRKCKPFCSGLEVYILLNILTRSMEQQSSCRRTAVTTNRRLPLAAHGLRALLRIQAVCISG